MSLSDNFIDLSSSQTAVDANFQFEFICKQCDRRWKSPIQPFRRGRIVGLLSRVSHVLRGLGEAERVARWTADAGLAKARSAAIAQAKQRAAQHFQSCEQCQRDFCHDCLNPSNGLCRQCNGAEVDAGTGAAGTGAAGVGAGVAAGPRCPSCSASMAGGRFCPDCGFDIASTHKSCPECGSLSTRDARYCPDCGHGF